MYPEGQHILVIDSNVTRRELTTQLLTDEGFTVTAVGEGFSGIRAASRGRFALAFAALRLPGSLDGATTLRVIRIRHPSLKALYTGGTGERPFLADRERDDFIGFPYHRRELLGCVFELLQRRRPTPHEVAG